MAISKVILNGTTQIDLTTDTVTNSAHIMNGYVGHLADGTQTTGTGQGGSTATLVQKTITLNGTYDPDDDSADGYSGVTVNVQGGASISETANTYGTTIDISSSPGSVPSTTRHTLYFEFEDETTETEYVYYDDSFISSSITATSPTTRNNKTVTLAELDGVEWYSYTPTPTPSGDWTTVWEGNANTIPEDPLPYFWIDQMSSVTIVEGETWRITINGTEYISTAQDSNDAMYGIVVGNPKYIGMTDDGTNVPYCWYNPGWGAWISTVNLSPSTTYSLKFERLATGGS